MDIKRREVPKDLKVLRLLYQRNGLSEEDQKQYFKLEKGFEGELRFDEMVKERLPNDDWLILSDLLLEINNRLTQIDAILISGGKIFNINVKNHEGDHYIKDGFWYMSPSGMEIHDPLLQLRRSELVLRQIIHSLGLNLPIVSKVIFINPDFTLYQAPMDLPIVLPTQLNRFFKDLLMSSSKPGKKEWALAKKLASMHITESPYSNVPPYTLKKLKKGVCCASCHSFKLKLVGKDLVCQICGSIEKLDSAIMRVVEDFHTLYPDRKITVKVISEWCGLDINRKIIERTLKKNLVLIKKQRYSYYLFMD